jgi:hypothetical protein
MAVLVAYVAASHIAKRPRGAVTFSALSLGIDRLRPGNFLLVGDRGTQPAAI